MRELISMDFGRSIRVVGSPGSPGAAARSGLAAEECQVFLKDRHPAYISWERFEANQARLAANRSRAESAGAVRDGAACWRGWSGAGDVGIGCTCDTGGAVGCPTYVCSTLRSDYGLPLCQSVSAIEVEAWVAQEVLVALQPAALDASLEAASRVDEQRRQVIRDWERRVERARYEADRAGRQYQACEPENRLVGRTLERRWDEALQAVRQVEEDFDRFLGAQPRRLGGGRPGADPPPGRGSADLVACPDDDARGPTPDREAPHRPGGADRRFRR